MKLLSQVIFWTIAAILVVPAVVGVFAGVAAVTVITLVGLVVALAALALICLSCIPIIWWCGMWESINTQQWLLKLKKTVKQPEAHN